MHQAIEKAETLVEALGWIREFRDKTTVIKLGGSLLDSPEALESILLDIHFMETVGMRPVVVHGAGKRISRAMEEAGLEPNFVDGRRVTDATTLEIVERVLAKETNEFLAEAFEKIGGRAMTLNFESTPVLVGEQLQPESGVDLGYVGHVTEVDRLVIDNLCYAGQVPFIPAMCEDESGQKYNVNADSAAMAVAQQINADKLVFLSDVAGVMADPDDPNTLKSYLDPVTARQMIDEGQVSGGMIPKVEACLSTLDEGVRKVHIVDGRLRHALLLEIFTDTGVGTLFAKSEKAEVV